MFRGLICCAVFVLSLFADELDSTLVPPGYMGCQKMDLARQMSLEDVVMYALCNNPKTKLAWESSLYQASLLRASRSSYYPTISATTSALRSESSETRDGNQENLNLNLSYLLYDFGKREASYENAKYMLDAALLSQNNTAQTLFLNSIQAYYALFGAVASLDASKEAERFASESLNAANTRYSVGATTPSDALQAKTAHSQAVLNRIRSEASVKNAQGELATVLGLMPDASVSLKMPKVGAPSVEFEKNIHNLMQEAIRQRPDLLAAEAKIRANEASVKAAKAEHMPTITLNASNAHTNTVFNTSTRGSNIGLYVNIPIFTGFSTKYKIEASKQQLKISEAEYERLKQEAYLEIYKSYQTLISETEAVRTSEDLVQSAKASYELSMGKYKAGVGTILDLLSTQSSLSSAKQQYVQALYNWHITKATLAKNLGELNFSSLEGEK